MRCTVPLHSRVLAHLDFRAHYTGDVSTVLLEATGTFLILTGNDVMSKTLFSILTLLNWPHANMATFKFAI